MHYDVVLLEKNKQKASMFYLKELLNPLYLTIKSDNMRFVKTRLPYRQGGQV